ncbi:hypothetical protein [Staphylococcus epidermidis]|uniref:hypothetical protein n=1 Tax=Staphylococcus epidermidis TaxID=1282 RepID=UPI00193252EE|nr:hypothetical protein [Staphylococcus epidermidis]MBM0755900.1 hypothetical protein [Staphylococcus epidermidis]MBM0816827.1 hypothetical protein [Staphylococcus epidermidis]HAR5545249.1 hypothetical protein [Staphylococcus aureus]HCZ2535065.1 hypothetical protein [Staphylococcus aureus]
MAGLKGLDNFEVFDVERFLKGKVLAFVDCEKNYNKKLDDEGKKIPDLNSPRGLKFEINIDQDYTDYEIFDFTTRERKKKSGVNLRKSFTVFIDKPDLEPEKYENILPTDEIEIKGIKVDETMHFGSNLILVADDIVIKNNKKQPQQQ